MRKVNSALTGEDGTLGKISAASAARASTDPVLLVQTVDATGKISTGISAVDDTAFDDGADKGTVIMGVNGAADIVLGHQGAVAMTKRRELMVVDGPHSSLPATHWSPLHGQVTYLNANSLTCTGFDFTVDSAVCNILSLGVVDVNNNLTLYQNGWNGYTVYALSNVLYILRYGQAHAAFLATDTKYRATINYKPVGDDITTDSKKVNEQSPLNLQISSNTLIPLGTTNTAAATYNFPSVTGMAIDGFKDRSLSYRFIDADGTITMTLLGTNDPAATSTSFSTVWAYDSNKNAMMNSWTVTNGTLEGTINLDNFNFVFFRVDVVFSGSTNTSELFMRDKAL